VSVPSHVETLASRIATIADNAQASVRQYAAELVQLPHGMNGEFTAFIEDKAAEVEAIADELERIMGSEDENAAELLEALENCEGELTEEEQSYAESIK